MTRPDQLFEVFTTNNPGEAEILRIALRSEGIACEIDGESQAGLAGLDMMEIKLLVRAEDFDRARSFVVKHQQRT